MEQAEVQHVDVLANLAHKRHVVLDEEDAAAPVGHDGSQHLAEPLGLAAVQAGGGLVHQEHVERAGQHPGQLDQPALADGQQADLIVGPGRRSGERQSLLGGRSTRRPALRDPKTWAIGLAPARAASRPMATFWRTVRLLNSSVR